MKPLAAGLALASAACVPNGEQRPANPLGERAYQKCYSCHALEHGRNDLSGPSLYRIVGRAVAAEPEFEYSLALKRFAAREPKWTDQLLDSYIADPEALVPGTSMTFHGIADPAERQALIDYLRRRSNQPQAR